MLRTGLSSVSHRAVAQGNKPLAMAPSRTIFHTGDKGRDFPLSKIVATIGPASEDAETLPAVVRSGLSVMRINFSHATDEEVQLRLKNLARTTAAYPLDGPGGMLRSVMLDTKGPEIRTGGLQAVADTGDVKAKVSLVKGETLTLTHNEAMKDCGDAATLFVTYPALASTVSVGGTVLLDDGAVSLTVTAIDGGGDVVCRIMNDGEIASRRGVNLPGAKVQLPAMSEKDRADIKYGIQNDMDFVAASFVRKASDIDEIRSWISKCHAEVHGAESDYPEAKIIAKVESTEALENLDEITEAADGIMVARGDLGVEVPLEEVVIWQKEMVEKCIAAAAGKPVVVATQMLESMQKNPRPTRAEVSDVTNAVLDGADCVMLSGESANGSYPVEVGRICSFVRSVGRWSVRLLFWFFGTEDQSNQRIIRITTARRLPHRPNTSLFLPFFPSFLLSFFCFSSLFIVISSISRTERRNDEVDHFQNRVVGPAADVPGPDARGVGE